MFHRMTFMFIWVGMAIGLLGIIGSRLAFLSDAEESMGLHVLYKWRGAVKPRADVVVVAIDRESAQALNLPAAPHKWPRALHARLLERLTDRRPAVVVFDLIFYDAQSENDDKAFAHAMRKAGNVILTQTIDRKALPLSNNLGGGATNLYIERIISAIPPLADAALGQAPFPLPKVPVKLSQYWCFRSGSGDAPTLPVVAMHVFAKQAFEAFIDLLRKTDADLASGLIAEDAGKSSASQIIQTIRPLHSIFEKDHTLACRMRDTLESRSRMLKDTDEALIRSLIGLYQHGDSRYLNLYGPPRTIPTISYHRLLETGDPVQSPDDLPSISGKAVFVGQTESAWFKANDGFYTPFTEKSGLDISGVEIAATAFANLLEDKGLFPLGPLPAMGLLLGWGIGAAFICLHFSTAFSTAGLAVLNAAYMAFALHQFRTHGIWYPLVTPVLIQSPVALVYGLAWKYRYANIERRNIREAFGHYLPDAVVNQLALDSNALRPGGQVLYSICLFTDAQNYTTLSETMDPESLTRIMNSYYESIFKPIKENGGVVSQVTGDSVLALWTAREAGDTLKILACRAAVAINLSVNRFNRDAGANLLPTRIGVHAGEILLGNIGADDHFEYRPVGDIVNTASRLEGLNKYLCTWMLVSEDAYVASQGIAARSMGQFVFKGKSQPVQVYELLPREKHPPEKQKAVCRIFERGLHDFRHRRWHEAACAFREVLEMDESDGPSIFYLGLCREHAFNPPDETWDGAVRLHEK